MIPMTSALERHIAGRVLLCSALTEGRSPGTTADQHQQLDRVLDFFEAFLPTAEYAALTEAYGTAMVAARTHLDDTGLAEPYPAPLDRLGQRALAEHAITTLSTPTADALEPFTGDRAVAEQVAHDISNRTYREDTTGDD